MVKSLVKGCLLSFRFGFISSNNQQINYEKIKEVSPYFLTEIWSTGEGYP